MHQKRQIRRALSIAGFALGLPAVASAAPPARGGSSCAASNRQAEEQVEAGHLRRAREAFVSCAAASCGGLIAQQCRAGLQHLEEDTPSVIFVVTDALGALLTDVRVHMDGDEVATRADGRSIDVDPGLHQFELSTDKNGVSAQQILILQGQRNRVVHVRLKGSSAAASSIAAPAATPVEQPSSTPAEQPAASLIKAPATLLAADRAMTTPERRAEVEPEQASPLLAYVVGGAGLAAIGGSLLLVHWAREDNLRLDGCAPNCRQESVDHVGNMYLAADITLGAGVAALGVATWLYLSRPERQERTTDQAYRFDIQPRPSGAFATIGRVF